MKTLILLLTAMTTALPALAADLDAVLAGSQRSEAAKARDAYRHPAQTLAFFRLKPDMTVVEISPGAGWYTEILAPYLKEQGTYHAAHFPENSAVPYFRQSREAFVAKLAGDPARYGAVKLTTFDPAAGALGVPAGSADLVVTFRNVHNWLRNDSEAQAFALFYDALKPGGLLGVVEHRTRVDRDRPWMVDNGYMTEQSVIALAEQAGFQLVERSEINANPQDSADHPAGVWTLPPTLRLAEENRDAYLAIGESDRMTLLFAKPTP